MTDDRRPIPPPPPYKPPPPPVKFKGRYVRNAPPPPQRWIVRWRDQAGRECRQDTFGPHRNLAINRARAIARKYGLMAVVEPVEPVPQRGEPT